MIHLCSQARDFQRLFPAVGSRHDQKYQWIFALQSRLQPRRMTVSANQGQLNSCAGNCASQCAWAGQLEANPTHFRQDQCSLGEVTGDTMSNSRPRHIAVIGAAGGLGQGILRVCRAEGRAFTAIVRSRPERITEVPQSSRVAVVPSLADRATLTESFSGADVVITALGVTPTSNDSSAMLSCNAAEVEAAMVAAGVDRLLIVNTLLVAVPGRPASRTMRFFSWIPGRIGRGAREQQAVVDALAKGAFSSIRWTLVRGGLNSRGKDEPPVATADWPGALNSWMPVSYDAMARWMIEEAAVGEFVKAAPLVSRRR